MIIVFWYASNFTKLTYTGDELIIGVFPFFSKQDLSEVKGFKIVNDKVSFLLLKNGKRKDIVGYQFGSVAVQKLIRIISKDDRFENEIIANDEQN